MLPKTASEKLSKAQARQANMECKFQEVQVEVDQEVEEVCKEHKKIEREEQDA